MSSEPLSLWSSIRYRARQRFEWPGWHYTIRPVVLHMSMLFSGHPVLECSGSLSLLEYIIGIALA